MVEEYLSEKASDNRRFLDGAILEARIWYVCRTEEQLKANAWNLEEVNPEGLLARWGFLSRCTGCLY